MADSTENVVLRMLRDIREKQDEHSDRFERLENRMHKVEQKLDSMSKVVTFSLGQSSEAKFSQAQQDEKIAELFDRLETLLADRGPAR